MTAGTPAKAQARGQRVGPLRSWSRVTILASRMPPVHAKAVKAPTQPRIWSGGQTYY